MKTKSITKLEGGITLISLVVMIILLVILAAVAVRGIIGEEGILGSTTSAVQRYSIEEYREKIAETAQKTIIESAILGEEASIDNLKNNLNSAANGLQTITINDNISDVIVKTNEGYLFDVYFDEVFSEYFVEYMGQTDPSYISEVNITYTEETKEIKVTVTKGNVNKIAITQNGKEEASGSNTVLTYTATNSGIYKITVETNEGITRYGYVNVGLKKDKLKAPEIRVAAGNEGNNGWYKSDVNVEIDPANTNGQTMHYRLTGAMTKPDTEITNMSSTIVEPVTSSGLTKVIAWVEIEEDGRTYRSDYSYFNVKIDNVVPNAPTAKITATQGNEIAGETQTNTYWYKTNVELEITANDDNSGIYGYTYSITGTKSVSETSLIGKTQKITFETDGTYTLIIKSIDKAGNISLPYTITVYKDSTPPNAFVPSISNITNTGFTISAYTMDDISGIAKYEYYVNNDKKYEGTDNTYTVTGLNKDTTYGVYINAIDKAGNVQASSAISVYTAGSTSGGTTGGGNTGDGGTLGYGTYTLDYNANGITATEIPDSRTFVYGETVTLPYDTPKSTQAGYSFLAWSTDPVRQETLYYPGNTITGYGNITLYAIWIDQCMIGFNPNGGNFTPKPQVLTSGGTIICPSTAGTNLNNPSATFLGWSYEPNSNYVYYLPGDKYDDYAYGATTLYAVWDLGVTVNIDLHGATYENTHDDVVPKKITYIPGIGVKLPTDAGTPLSVATTSYKWTIGNEDGSEMGQAWEGTSGALLNDKTANGKTLHAIWDLKVKMGDYVAYTPDSTNPTSYSTTQDGSNRNGNDSAQTIPKDTNLKWRVLKVDTANTRIALISEKGSSSLSLSKADGYNNGVKLLNDSCKMLYSNTHLGATGRSANIDDINELMGITEEMKRSMDGNYGVEFEKNNSNFPHIFADEKVGCVNSKWGTILGPSEQSIWYSGSTRATILRVKPTYYTYTLSTYKGTNTVEYSLANVNCLLASRCIYKDDNITFWYGLFNIVSSTVNYGYTCCSGTTTGGTGGSIRPVIEIDLNKVIVGATGSGTSSDQFSITAK